MKKLIDCRPTQTGVKSKVDSLPLNINNIKTTNNENRN